MNIYREKHLNSCIHSARLFPTKEPTQVLGCPASAPLLPCSPTNSPRSGLSTPNLRNVLETQRTVFQCVVYSSAIWNLTWCSIPHTAFLFSHSPELLSSGLFLLLLAAQPAGLLSCSYIQHSLVLTSSDFLHLSFAVLVLLQLWLTLQTALSVVHKSNRNSHFQNYWIHYSFVSAR